MSEFMPPVTAEFVANTTGFLKGITAAIDSLTRLSTVSRETALAVTESFTAITDAARIMGSSTAEATAVTKTQLQGVARAVRSTGTAASTAAANTEKAMKGLTTSVDAMATGVEGAATRASTSLAEVGTAARTAAGETAAAAKTTTTTAATSATGAAGALTKIGKATSIVGLGVGAASIKMAADFESGTMVLVTAAGEVPANLEKVRAGIKTMAVQTGNSWHDLTEGMYQAEKAGFNYAKGGLDVVRVAAQGAREEGAPLNDVVHAMTTIMNNYHLPASKAVQVMNALKTGAGMSTVTFAQFNSALATVLPIASSVGMSFDKVAGAMSVMTQHGETARHATQLLNNTIRNLKAPNDKAVKEMDAWGISSSDVSKKLGQRGVAGTLQYLSETILKKMGPAGAGLKKAFDSSTSAAKLADGAMAKMPSKLQSLAKEFANNKISSSNWSKELNHLSPLQKTQLQQWATLEKQAHGFGKALKSGGPAVENYTTVMKKMTGGANGLQATMELTGANYSKVTTNIKRDSASLNDASKDVEGWGATQKQLTVQLAQLKQVVEVMAISIGQKLIPPLSRLLTYFKEHQGAAKALAAVIAGGLTLALAAFVTKGIFKTIGAVTDLGKSFVGTAQKAGQFVKAVAGAEVGPNASGAAKAGGAIRSGVGGIGKGVSAGAKAAKSAFDSLRLRAMYAYDAIKAGGSKVASGLKSAGSAARTLGSRIGDATKAGGKAAWTGLANGAKAAGGALKTAALAALDFSRKALIATAAAIKQAAAFVWDKISTLAAAAAEKAMAAAEWVLNVAMDANPIMLIVLAIAALVAALIYAYTHFKWFKDAVDAVFQFVKNHWQLVLIMITGPIGIAVGLVIHYWKQISGAFNAAVSFVVNFVKSHWQLIVGLITGPIGLAVSFIVSHWHQITSAFSSAWSAVKSTAASAVKWVSGLPGQILHALGNLGTMLYNAGSSIITGLWNGIKSQFNIVKNGLSSLTSLLPSWKGPPSKDKVLLHGAGQMIIEGLVAGMGSRFAHVKNAATGVGVGIQTAFATELGIASPSKKFKALGAWVLHGLVDGLTGSTKSVKSATNRLARDLYVDFGSSHKGLQSYVAKEDSQLNKLAKNRDAVAAKLKSAQKKLTDLQKAWTTERDSVASGIMQNATIITAPPQEGFALTANDVVNNLKDQVAKANQFAAELKALQKKGLSSDLIQQIAAAGVDQGGATAQALAGASKGTIDQLNSLQGSMKTAANSAGGAVADSMYKAGIDSAKGLVKGLASQEKAIQKQMDKIAKSMQKALKAALGIKSPSTVFASLSKFVPLGVARGVEDNAHHAVTAVKRMASAVTKAGTFGTSGLVPAGVGGGGGGVVVNNHLTLKVEGSVMTERQLVDVVQRGFLKLGGRNSQTWQPFKR